MIVRDDSKSDIIGLHNGVIVRDGRKAPHLNIKGGSSPQTGGEGARQAFESLAILLGRQQEVHRGGLEN
jgi:hypothetical protein